MTRMTRPGFNAGLGACPHSLNLEAITQAIYTVVIYHHSVNATTKVDVIYMYGKLYCMHVQGTTMFVVIILCDLIYDVIILY